ncbi:MAG TPA: right-handed parallel beta-helix repeat-containing protein [Verrucomicrobiae bacterium]|nr:right-handed parallel beta-helix repeat-containing protein [Verrucomicrobiae bacterium]
MCKTLIAATLLALACGRSLSAELFVAPDGDDANPGTRSKPLASFQAAQQHARAERKHHPSQPVTVTFRAGAYSLEQPLEFTPEDSGVSAQQPVRYRAHPGESVVITAGRLLSGWQPDPQRPGVWMTRAAGPEAATKALVRFNQLWINGRRAVRARAPNELEFGTLNGFASEPETNGRSGFRHIFTVNPELLASLPADAVALHDVQVVVFHKWDTTREPIESVSREKGIFITHSERGEGSNPIERGCQFFLENWLAALDAPGEWFLDSAGWVYYRQRPGELMPVAEAIAPQAERFLTLRGNADSPEDWVQHIRFEGLKFRFAAFRIPPEGLPPEQASMNVQTAAVELNAARDIRFLDCAVEHIGATAFWFRHACRDCLVLHTRMFDLGISGVRIGEKDIVPEPVRTGHITIDDCIIQAGGRIMPQSVGVWIGQSSDNSITHCDIGDFFYTAVSVGWRWGYAESAAKRNHIEFNHLHHLGYRILSDMGGVYTLGPSEGATVRNNLIHDVYAARYGGWGLYTDEGSSGILFENNLVHDVLDGCIHQHYGKENIFRNNIFAFSQQGQIAATRAEPHLSFTFEHNIVYWDNGFLLGYSAWKNGVRVILRDNLYWRAGAKPFDFAGKTWQQWRAEGNDEGSRIANPRFFNASHRDFRLHHNSPAIKLGFKPFDLAAPGVQGHSWRKLAALPFARISGSREE